MIADLHLDALLDVLEQRELGDDDAFAQRHLPMLEAAGVRVQVLPAFVDDRHLPESALRVTIQQLDAKTIGKGGALRVTLHVPMMRPQVVRHVVQFGRAV